MVYIHAYCSLRSDISVVFTYFKLFICLYFVRVNESDERDYYDIKNPSVIGAIRLQKYIGVGWTAE